MRYIKKNTCCLQIRIPTWKHLKHVSISHWVVIHIKRRSRCYEKWHTPGVNSFVGGRGGERESDSGVTACWSGSCCRIGAVTCRRWRCGRRLGNSLPYLIRTGILTTCIEVVVAPKLIAMPLLFGCGFCLSDWRYLLLFYFILFFALFLRTDTFNTEKETMGGDASFKYFTAQTVVDSRIAARLNTKRNNSTCCTRRAGLFKSLQFIYIGIRSSSSTVLSACVDNAPRCFWFLSTT